MENTELGSSVGYNINFDAAFQAFDSYPWAEDPKFAMLVKGTKSRGVSVATPTGLLAVRVAFATKFLSLPISNKDYVEWVQAQGPDYVQPDYKLTKVFDGISSDTAIDTEKAQEKILSWQAAAPKADLVVDIQTQQGSGQPPANFAELLKYINEGVPVPGVRDIPSTVARDASIKPFGTRVVPKKPWEQDDAAAAMAAAMAEGGLAVIDQEFPPLNDE